MEECNAFYDWIILEMFTWYLMESRYFTCKQTEAYGTNEVQCNVFPLFVYVSIGQDLSGLNYPTSLFVLGNRASYLP